MRIALKTVLSILCLSGWAMIGSAHAQTSAAPVWTIDPAASSIGFSGTHSGNEFKGTFTSWTGEIAFDPQNLEASSATIKIDTSSAQTGDKTYDGTLPNTDWLDSKTLPEAVFASSAFRQVGDDTYEVDGTLTIKNIKQDLTFPFTLQIEGDTATMDANLELDRLAFGVGKDADPKAEWVSANIGVTLQVKATRQP